MLVSHDAQRHNFHHLGRAGELIPIILLNFLFQLLTLGLFRFWAITRLRRYLWSRTFFHDDPVEYTGTGKELFLGFLLAALIVLVPLIGLQYAVGLLQASGETRLAAIAGAVYSLLVVMLTPIALYRARRYRLNRTVWRGIRWGQSGSAMIYAGRWVGLWFVTLITLGLAYPWQSIGLERYRLNHTHFGSQPLRFDGTARPLFGKWIKAWALALAIVVALGVVPAAVVMEAAGGETIEPVAIEMALQKAVYALAVVLPALIALVAVLCWYKAAELRYVAAHTQYQGMRFMCTVTGRQLAWLGIGNLLLRVFTLGLGAPYGLVRTARLMARTLSAEGVIDFDRVRQNADELSKMGEGLAAAINVGEF